MSIGETNEQQLIRLVTLGSVDDGKSTLLGRLLYDSGNLPHDQRELIEQSRIHSGLTIFPDFSLVTDGLLSEQEQKITIDVAYRYFRTKEKVFILADSPGHEQYTRNMVTAASNADIALLLMDVKSGVTDQTRRHTFIASLLGIKRLIVLVNKMDLVGYSERVFQDAWKPLMEFSRRLQFVEFHPMPISALAGDNIVEPSRNMPWYRGLPLLSYLEGLYSEATPNPIDFRYQVQRVVRPDQSYRGFSGQILSGHIRKGDKVAVLPTGTTTRVRAIDVPGNGKMKELDEAHAMQSITLRLEDEVDVSRGDMIVKVGNSPRIEKNFEATLVWIDHSPLNPNQTYILHHCSRFVKVNISNTRYKIDIRTLKKQDCDSFHLNDIGRFRLSCHEPLFCDPYAKNRRTGSFILIDPETSSTCAAGMILDRQTAKNALDKKPQQVSLPSLHRENSGVTLAERNARNGHAGFTIWFTGLSGSGKSTLSRALERKLFENGWQVSWLDGDNLRTGLCSGLGFDREARRENLRRAAEVAKLFNNTGTITICSFITPHRADQHYIQEIIGKKRVHLVHLTTPLEVCEERDPHGNYKKVRAGILRNFSGIDSPYEAPETPALSLDTSVFSETECLSKLMELVHELNAAL